MPGFKILREEDKHFVAHNGSKEFRIAKKGIPEKKAAHFQSLCEGGEVKPQKLAEGGSVAEKKTDRKQKGGEVLAGHKLLREDEHAFHVEGPSGAFRVAKGAIGPALAERIRQHFAEGGEVEEEIPVTGDPGLDMIMKPESTTPEMVASLPPSELDRREAVRAAIAAPGNPVTSASGVPYIPGSDTAPPEIPKAEEPKPEAPPPEVAAARTHPATPRLPAGVPDPAQYVPPTVVQPPAQATPQIGVPGSGLTADVQREVAQSAQQEQAAIAEKARIQAEEANKAAAIQEQANRQRAEITSQFQQRYSDWQARGEKLFNEVQNAKVDPGRFWKDSAGNVDTGRKVTGAIAMILGGLGAGLARGPNYALQVIDKAIDRDVAAQELEMKKKENVLRYHLEQGNEMRSAYLLTKADLLDATAGQIQANALRAAGPKAQQEAALASAQIRQNAAGLRMQIAAHGQQMALQGLEAQMKAALFPLQVQQAKQQVEVGDVNLRMQRAQMQAIGELLNGGGKGGSVGAQIDPRVVALLPKEFQERMVSMPDGSFALARTPKAAEEVQKSQEGASVLRAKLQRYAEILARHPHGVSSTLSPEDYELAKTLRASMMTDINGLAGMQRFTHEEAEKYVERIPDITAKQFRAVGHQTGVGELGREIDEKVWGMNQNFLNVPRRRMPGGP